MGDLNPGVILVIGLVGGVIGWLIGNGKGKGAAGFWLGFVLGFIGWIIVAGMKPTPEVAARRLAEAPGAPHNGYSPPGYPQPGPTQAYVPTSPLSPAGWHPDPHHRFELRYWDGYAWTQHVSSMGRTSIDPV